MNNQYLMLIALLAGLVGCAPAIVGGGGVVAASAAKEKGLTGTIEDSKISYRVGEALYSQDTDLAYKISYHVENGEVFLTGSVSTPEESQRAAQIVSSVKGVKRVVNRIGVGKDTSIKGYVSDSWITATLRNQILWDNDIQSMNYTVKTIEGVVYISGIAQDANELNRVLEHARKIKGVRKVVNYARLKNDPFLKGRKND